MLPDAECSDCSLKGGVLRDAGISLTFTSLMGCDKVYGRHMLSLVLLNLWCLVCHQYLVQEEHKTDNCCYLIPSLFATIW